ncbi:hypothetical protein BGZ98_005991 [Dissophora globulifera]|nr:hypothetical protein BGZ98_005991 [Dissophora globulifera]
MFGDSAVAVGEAGQIFEFRDPRSATKAPLLQLHLADVGGDAVKLMSHFIWNAALVMADYIDAANIIDVRGKRVIEFGAGTALPGLVCAKRGADFVMLTDYPDPKIIHNLERNWYENLVESAADKQDRLAAGSVESIHTIAYQDLLSQPLDISATSDNATDATSADQRRQPSRQRLEVEQEVKCAVRGHAWGESVQKLLECLPGQSDQISVQKDDNDNGGKFHDAKAQGYDWILLADTLWMSESHAALLTSCSSVLKRSTGTDNDNGGKILICCGLHTGYFTVQKFLTLAQSDQFGFRSRLIEIWRVPEWGETRSVEELKQESTPKEEDIENYSFEDRNRTVLVYELSWR